LGEMETRIKKEIGEKAEREKLEAEESVNRKRRQDEWVTDDALLKFIHCLKSNLKTSVM